MMKFHLDGRVFDDRGIDLNVIYPGFHWSHRSPDEQVFIDQKGQRIVEIFDDDEKIILTLRDDDAATYELLQWVPAKSVYGSLSGLALFLMLLATWFVSFVIEAALFAGLLQEYFENKALIFVLSIAFAAVTGFLTAVTLLYVKDKISIFKKFMKLILHLAKRIRTKDDVRYFQQLFIKMSDAHNKDKAAAAKRMLQLFNLLHI